LYLTVFLAIQILTPLFSLTVLNFVVFFMLLDRKFNEDSKNVLKTVIFSLQVSFTGDFVPDCSLNRVQILNLFFLNSKTVKVTKNCRRLKMF